MASNPGILAGLIVGLIALAAILPISILLLWRKLSDITAARKQAAAAKSAAKGKAPMHARTRTENAAVVSASEDIEMVAHPAPVHSLRNAASSGDMETAAMPQRGVVVARAMAEMSPLPGISTRTLEDEQTLPTPIRAVAGEADAYGMGWKGEGFDFLRRVGKGVVKRWRRMREGMVVAENDADAEGGAASDEMLASDEPESARSYYEQAQQGGMQLQHLEASEQAEAVKSASSAAAASRAWGSPA